MLINIFLVSKGGRGLLCELVITMCDKLGRSILCSVFCPFEYLENALHAFFMMKKVLDSFGNWGNGRVKKFFQLQTLTNRFVF
ncbi:unnamed protein product [Staurois parvus]|uniref:Uncharacterized protein n=1 Tax=Staurois parvus TaxID=386267 RepID=A0ABN9B9X4_9NEOB|nr:unnamed protein product [Staurois parvus]